MQFQGQTPFLGASGQQPNTPASLEQRKAQLIQRLANGGMNGAMGSGARGNFASPIFGQPVQLPAQGSSSPMSTGGALSHYSNPYHSMGMGQIGAALGNFGAGGV